MNIDGVFLHYLVNELRSELINTRINKFILVNQNEFMFQLSSHKNLFVSLNNNTPHIRLTKTDVTKSTKTSPFFTVLKKYSEGSIITSVNQIDNDRLLVIELNTFDELGYIKKIKFIVELYGRNSNFIIASENDVVIDLYKKLFPSEDEKRTLLPKMTYTYQKMLPNPFCDNVKLTDKMQGVSSTLLNEMIYSNDIGVINRRAMPTLIKKDNKYYFYAFPLKHLEGEETYFSSLSELLEYYFYSIQKDTSLSDEQNLIRQHLLKALKRAESKLEKQRQEKKQAIANLECEKIGNLLSSNLHLIKKNMDKIEISDFYQDGKMITISLNPSLTPSQNLNHYYQKYKKAKRSLEVIDDQIDSTIKEIDYYNQILEQLEIGKSGDLLEVMQELNLKKQKTQKKDATPNIAIYKDKENNMIYVGKNNIQNNYLTHKFAKSTDYFLHVASYSGSHTILRCEALTDYALKNASMIALMYSKSRGSVGVAVDYTLVKYVKKVPKTFGSFVTYTNQKTIHVTIDNDYINENITRLK